MLIAGLAAACIETDPPVIRSQVSVAPNELVGAWVGQDPTTIKLVERVDEHRLRVSQFANGRLQVRSIVHAARLPGNVFALEDVRGLRLVQVTGQNGLRDVVPSKNSTPDEFTVAARKHGIDIGLSTPANGQFLIRAIRNAEYERLVPFLGGLIERAMLVPSGWGEHRISDARQIAAIRKQAEELAANQQKDFVSVLARLLGTPEDRAAACKEMEKMALAGHLEANTQHGRCRLYGWGGKSDCESGLRTLHRASFFGSTDAMFEVAKAWTEDPASKAAHEQGRDLLASKNLPYLTRILANLENNRFVTSSEGAKTLHVGMTGSLYRFTVRTTEKGPLCVFSWSTTQRKQAHRHDWYIDRSCDGILDNYSVGGTTIRKAGPKEHREFDELLPKFDEISGITALYRSWAPQGQLQLLPDLKAIERNGELQRRVVEATLRIESPDDDGDLYFLVKPSDSRRLVFHVRFKKPRGVDSCSVTEDRTIFLDERCNGKTDAWSDDDGRTWKNSSFGNEVVVNAILGDLVKFAEFSASHFPPR
ncbi:MAG TPA: hypothetical protein VGE10_15490 [Zeimonas sp.]